MSLAKLSYVPKSVPEANKKVAELREAGADPLNLGQGLIFTPDDSSEEAVNRFMRENGLDPSELRFGAITKKGNAGDVYNSARLDEVWADMQTEGFREPEAFGGFVKEVARDTMHKLFQFDPETTATLQVDSLMQALRNVFHIVPKLNGGRRINSIVLPANYQYSGHREFVESLQSLGSDVTIETTPEVQIDGSQDLDAMREAFIAAESEGRVVLFVDQENNNNASGFDRDPALNDDLCELLKEFADTVIYFGDNPYKGLKHDILDPYPLTQALVDAQVTAFHYFSASKITNYRGTPSFKSTLAATPGKLANTDTLRSEFSGKNKRFEGIGATGDGAILMNRLAADPEFIEEVRVLNQYLKFIRDGLAKALEGTDLEPYFGPETNGIFRCLPPEVIQRINANSGVTVGQRINIWPLGQEDNRDQFVDMAKAA